MPDARPLQPGDPDRLGSYEITGRLGEGGQGTVYLGRSASGDPVAIKLLRGDLAQDDTARGRFLRELAAVKRVARFCTAQVLEADVDGDRPYIVSEYVPGPSLQQLVTGESPRSGAELERLAIGTVTALVAIHQAGIVHRDFKPQNVLIGPDGPRVIDFGIAKALDTAATMTNSAIGTPAYMAPEQLAGREITPAADIFAWGSTMVYAATGTAAFGQDTVMAVINRILSEPPDLGSMQEPLRGIVAGCLAKDPAARPTAQQLLMRLLGEESVTPAGPVAAGGPQTAILDQGAAFAETRFAGAAPTSPVTPAAPTVAGAGGIGAMGTMGAGAAGAGAMGAGAGAPTMPHYAAVTHPGGASRQGVSSRMLLAAVAGLVLTVGIVAMIVWAAGHRADTSGNHGPVPSVESSNEPSDTGQPEQPAPDTSRPEPTYTRPRPTHTPTHTRTATSEPSSEPSGGSTPTGGPTGGTKPTGGSTGGTGDGGDGGGGGKTPGGQASRPAG
ncbi:serine/threonine protein kinase [Actinoallomurus purpureus]|uniref:serine/threonine-protein kinase n=1 Tax=Actinoallomurus purpureus TaxID=478114 RepID=UPI002092FCE0|nr:serine/threonine-protein kinase [Actinoallomurus purpureus]MCO6006590.1 serine/threonine protein kinase [Actinoallomurus purpureus]